jgi:uncharacterized low-complexity protein
MTKAHFRWILALAVVLCGAFVGQCTARAAGYCTQTADLLLDACKASVMDDGSVGKAMCINIEDAKENQSLFGRPGGRAGRGITALPGPA